MKHRFFDIETAFEYVSSQPTLVNSALLDRETGEIFYFSSEFDDLDEEVPEDFAERDSVIQIPHQRDLDLGNELVDRFVAERAPGLAGQVAGIFSRRGAYSQFKALLQSHRLLDAWYEYESANVESALRKWCADNNIDLAEDSSETQ